MYLDLCYPVGLPCNFCHGAENRVCMILKKLHIGTKFN